MSEERTVRDIIDDIMVQMDLLESELARVSREEKYKGRMVNILYRIENIRDLLVELRKASGYHVSS